MKQTLFASVVTLYSLTGFADFQTLTDIESRLDPMEFIANYDGVRRSIDLDIRFELNSAELTKDTTGQLDVLGEAMAGERLSKYSFDIVGHTDASGDAQENMTLSIERARRVSLYLEEIYKIDSARLNPTGKGETALKKKTAPTDPSQRRVEIVARPLDATESAAPASVENTVDEEGKVEIAW